MNSNHTPILFPYEPDELWEKIRELLRAELQKSQSDNRSVSYSVPGLTEKPLFKPHEVCAMLQVSRQTLHSWARQGILRPYKIKSRVFYLWRDLEKLIKPADEQQSPI